MLFLSTSSFRSAPSRFPTVPFLSSKQEKLHSLSSISLRQKGSLFGCNMNLKPNRCIPRNNSPVTRPNFTVRASSKPANAPSDAKLITLSAALTVVLAVANRVLYKLALVPMKEYPFFLAQFTTFGYVVIYFSILFIRYRAGIVTNEMLGLPKSRFLAIGILEALGLASGMASAAMLPGPSIPILNQTFLVWQLVFSTIILGRRYLFNQIAGCLLVAIGVVVAVSSGSDTGKILSGVNLMWPGVMIASAAFQAGASIIKEFIFLDAAKQLRGKSLDIFVVNSFGSGFQVIDLWLNNPENSGPNSTAVQSSLAMALFVLLLLPVLSNLKGIPFSGLPSYLKSGAGCFLKIGADISGCEGAPLLPLLYIITNMAFNISVLGLLKISSAIVASLAVTLSVPISIYILSLPLPYLPEGTSLSPFFLFGSLILLLGLILYNITRPVKEGSKSA